jgi:hypothetical protein
MAPNPLVYPMHVLRHPDFIAAKAEARRFRDSGISYNLSLVLKHSETLKMNRAAFYNSKRSEPKRLNTESERINTMFDSMVRNGFHVCSRWSTATPDSQSPLSSSYHIPAVQQFEQLLFCTNEHIILARRFVSGTIYECDATFKTNVFKMPLATNVGITNTGKTFPFAMSFVHSESKEAFGFVFRCVCYPRLVCLASCT